MKIYETVSNCHRSSSSHALRGNSYATFHMHSQLQVGNETNFSLGESRG